MKFEPKTEEEINTFSLCPEGEFSFEVLKAEEKMSKKGNPMIELILKIWDDNGEIHTVYDYLMEAIVYKLKHFCDSTGLKEKYDNGELTDFDCELKTGKVKIIHQKDRNDSSKVRASVKDYIVDSSEVKESPKESSIEDDDVPF